MSDIVDISTLAGTFRDTLELQDYCNKQFLALSEAAKKVKRLQDEVDHLKRLLAATTPLLEDNRVEKIILTPEEALIEEQIDILRCRSFGKELTLEDTKKLDLLIKNKRLVKEQSTTIVTEPRKPDKKNLTAADLARIASKPKDEQL